MRSSPPSFIFTISPILTLLLLSLSLSMPLFFHIYLYLALLSLTIHSPYLISPLSLELSLLSIALTQLPPPTLPLSPYHFYFLLHLTLALITHLSLYLPSPLTISNSSALSISFTFSALLFLTANLYIYIISSYLTPLSLPFFLASTIPSSFISISSLYYTLPSSNSLCLTSLIFPSLPSFYHLSFSSSNTFLIHLPTFHFISSYHTLPSSISTSSNLL